MLFPQVALSRAEGCVLPQWGREAGLLVLQGGPGLLGQWRAAQSAVHSLPGSTPPLRLQRHKMSVVIYGILPSPFCRPVLMAAKAIGVDVEMKTTSPLTGDTHKPDYLQLNPRHNIPTMVDDDYILTESRAIMCYLVDKYGQEDDPLFPKDPQQRNRVLERMLFDVICLTPRCYDYYNKEWIFGGADLDESKLPPLVEAIGFLDKYLENANWVAGDNMTLADIGLAVTVSQLEIFGMDFEPYANVTRWFEACKSDLPGYDEINEEGARIFKTMISK